MTLFQVMPTTWLAQGSHKDRHRETVAGKKWNKTSFKDKLILYKINYDVLAQTFSLAETHKPVTISF